MNTTISEMKNTLETINIRFDESENWSKDLENKIAEDNQNTRKKKVCVCF